MTQLSDDLKSSVAGSSSLTLKCGNLDPYYSAQDNIAYYEGFVANLTQPPRQELKVRYEMVVVNTCRLCCKQ